MSIRYTFSFFAALLWAVTAPALTVLNTNDLGAGSLRKAIADATPGDTITFDAALDGQTITLTSGQILLNRNLHIDASALSGGITIDGNGSVTSNRIFEVAGGTTNLLDSLILTNGLATGSWPAHVGGAIFVNSGAHLTINRSTLCGNSAEDGGGGIDNRGTLTLNHSTLSGNSAGFEGGGINNVGGGTLTLNSSTLSDNSAYRGGGIINYPNSTVTITHSTLSGNSAEYGGGVIIFNGGTMTLNSSTLSGNSAEYDGGILNEGVLNAINSIIAGNNAPTDPNLRGPLATDVNNLSGAVPLLAPLGDYSGPTRTMPPLPGSPAIDMGTNTTLSTDQRGFPRVSGPAADIGAAEYQGAFDNTLFWTLDTDDDGNAFGMEFALGTDWATADESNPANLTALAAGGAAFGLNPDATNSTVWVLKRSLDLVSDPFTEVYRYDGPTAATSTNIPVTVTTTASGMQVQDDSGVTNAFYQFSAEPSPNTLL